MTRPRQSFFDEDFLRRLEKIEIASRRIFRGRFKGERLSRKRGTSSEFADYRNYVEGDDLRFIDWNIYGRLDRLFLKLFLEEEDLHVHILLDTSLSMSFGSPRKIDFGRRLAAAVGYIALCRLDRVQIHAFAHGLACASSALRGKKNAWQMFDFLSQLECDGRTNLAAACRAFAQRFRAGKGAALVISDFLDPAGYEEGLRQLVGRGYDICVLHVLAPEEIRPAVEGDLRLVDVEDESAQEITVSQPLLAQYQKTLQNFCSGLKGFCTQHGAAYAFASAASPLEEVVFHSLRHAGLLR
ncbi:MAG: DUF58 domain-containing protein [Planctomycetota bacterium]|nr:DUF58 domain-containing protein [Planctomycetota bacterium]